MNSATTCNLDQVTLRIGGRSILEGVSLQVAPHERVGLLGPSGAGKTTLLRVLGGGLPPSQGKVQLLGSDPWTSSAAELRTLRSAVGFIHQDLALVPNLAVWQNVAAGRLGKPGGLRHSLSMIRATRPQLRALHETLEKVGIGDLLFQRTQDLSGGEQQRVAIARSLYQEPSILLADEPVASLDPTRAQQVMELLVNLAHEAQLPLVVTLHDLELARKHMDRLIGLRAGRVVFDSPSEDVTEGMIDGLYALPAQGDPIP